MLYQTIYWCSKFGTCNFRNANLSNGLYIMYYIMYARWNFGTRNFWNANPSNGLFALYSLYWCSNLEYLNYWDVSLLNIPEIVYVLSMVCLKCCGPLWLQKIITLPACRRVEQWLCPCTGFFVLLKLGESYQLRCLQHSVSLTYTHHFLKYKIMISVCSNTIFFSSDYVMASRFQYLFLLLSYNSVLELYFYLVKET